MRGRAIRGSTIVLLLSYLGMVVFALTLAWNLLDFAFFCFVPTPPSTSTLQGKIPPVLDRLTLASLPGAFILISAWLLCLVLLWRTRWWGWFSAVLIVLPLMAGIAFWVIQQTLAGQSLPTSCAVFSDWVLALWKIIPFTLIGMLPIFVAGHRLRRVNPQ